MTGFLSAPPQLLYHIPNHINATECRINALGYTCFASGAMEVALGGSLLPLHPLGWSGQCPPRRSITPYERHRSPTAFSVAGLIRHVLQLNGGENCPMFWAVSSFWFTVSMVLASLVAFRTLVVRSVQGITPYERHRSPTAFSVAGLIRHVLQLNGGENNAYDIPVSRRGRWKWP
jgi:hypothetical protein